MALSNKDKKQHGQNAINSLEALLAFCRDKGLIKEFLRNFRTGYTEFSDKQFLAHYIITFESGEKWILFSTTSMRTDRIKGQQWDTANIKNIEDAVRKCYLVYPDSVSDDERSEFVLQDNKYTKGEEYSVIDRIVNQDELFTLIEDTCTRSMTTGRSRDLRGRTFEKRVADILSYPVNLTKWVSDDELMVGLNYKIFSTIVEKFNIDKKLVATITATSDETVIGRLPSRGKPKTDVLVTVTYKDGSEHIYTISCKSTNSNAVSFHQYSYEAFSKALDPTNANLKNLLSEFQKCGNLRDFGEANSNALTQALRNYNEKLAMWVLGGVYGEGNPETQWAKYLLAYNNADGTFNIHTIEEYYQKLKDAGITGHFGTVFSWTFASGQKGKSIQLKCKVIK